MKKVLLSLIVGTCTAVMATGIESSGLTKNAVSNLFEKEISKNIRANDGEFTMLVKQKSLNGMYSESVTNAEINILPLNYLTSAPVNTQLNDFLNEFNQKIVNSKIIYFEIKGFHTTASCAMAEMKKNKSLFEIACD